MDEIVATCELELGLGEQTRKSIQDVGSINLVGCCFTICASNPDREEGDEAGWYLVDQNPVS